MTKPVIVTRLGKGSELTFEEGDSNFINLRDATINVSGDSGDTQNIDLNGTINVAGGTGISTAMSNGAVTVNLENTAVSPNTYTKATITVDQQGRVTSAESGSITSMDVTTALGFTPYNSTNPNGYISGVNSTDITTALGFTPENSGNKNAANGYAGLDSSGKVASAQLPSYVDDVIEVADYASLPTTGETGKIYVALDTNVTYRWSGTAYVEITSSPGSTDEVTEGTTNLYFTDARARNAVSAGSGIEYDNTTGVIKITTSGLPTVTSGNVTAIDGTTDYITVSSTAGMMMSTQISFSGAGLTGSGIMPAMNYWITNIDGANSAIQISDTMGGMAKDLTTVTITPGDATFQISSGGGSSTYKLQYSPTGQMISWTPESTTPQSYSLSSLTDVSITPPVTDGYVLTYDSMMGRWQAEALPASGIASVSADTAPMLGGNLDVNGKSIVSVSNGNIALTPNGTGKVILDGLNWPTSDGSMDQVLKTDGSGNLSWAFPNGPTIANDTTTNATFYPTLASQSYGSLNGTSVSSTKLSFNPSTGLLTATGFTGAFNGTVGATTPSTGKFTTLTVNAGNELRLADSDSSNYVGFKAPATVSANKIWTLPAADGTSGQVLSTNGSGTLSWATAGGGSSGLTRIDYKISGYFSYAGASPVGWMDTTNTVSLLSAGGTTASVSGTTKFSLPAGTYLFIIPPTILNGTSGDYIPEFSLYNETDAVILSEVAPGSFTTSGIGFFPGMSISFTLASTKVLKFQTKQTATQTYMWSSLVLTPGQMVMSFIKTS